MNITMFFSLTIIITLIIISVVCGIFSPKRKIESNVCWTNECREISSMLERNMNCAKAPCDDFYEYVCGKFAENNVPKDSARWDHYDSINKIAERNVIQYLKSPVNKRDSPVTKWAKNQYKACMNARQLHNLGVQLLVDKVKKCGGWTIHKQFAIWTAKQWHEIHDIYNRQMGKGGLVTIGVKYEPINREYLIGVSTTENVFGHKRGSLQSSDIKKYTQFLTDMSAQICSFSFNANLTKDGMKAIERVIEFRETLTTIKERSRTHGSECTMSIHTLQEETERQMRNKPLNWLRLLKSTFQSVNIGGITDSTWIYIDNFPLLLATLKVIDDTPEEVIINHLHFYFLENYIRYSNMKIYYEAYTDALPRRLLEHRSETCITERTLAQAFDLIYLHHILPKKVLLEARRVVEDVRRTLKDQISRTRWMKKVEKEIAMENVDSIYDLIKPADLDTNPKMVSDYYSNLSISNDYMQNTFNFDSFSYSKDLSLFRPQSNTKQNKGGQRKSCSVRYPDYQAHTDYDKMLFAKRTMLLLVTHFGVKVPHAINYAGYGAIHGALMANVVASTGDQRSGHANSQWDKKSMDKYMDRWVFYTNKISNSIPKEFAAANIKLKFHPTLHIDRAIREYMGLVAAYEAYRERMSSDSSGWDKLIDVEDVDGDKLFFVVYAMNRCEAINAQVFASTMNMSDKNVDLPARLTVNAAVSNMQAFADTFGCDRNKPMSPTAKCEFFSELDGSSSSRPSSCKRLQGERKKG